MTPPNHPKTPTHSVRVPDELWQAAQARASDEGETVSDVVRRALEQYVRRRVVIDGRAVAEAVAKRKGQS